MRAVSRSSSKLKDKWEQRIHRVYKIALSRAFALKKSKKWEGRDFLEFYYCSYLFLRKEKNNLCVAHWNYLIKSNNNNKL